MRRIAFLLIIIAFISCSRNDKNDFGKHFLDKTLRINLVHSGDACDESFKLEQIYDDGLWYGRTKNLVNPYRLGTYLYEVRDIETDELLYSDGISTLFGEWRLTEEAKDTKRSFNESIRIPYPNKDAKITMYRIDSLDVTEPVWEYILNKESKSLIEPAKNHNNRSLRLLDSGNPKEKVDIIILGDGYTIDDIKLFGSDVVKFYNSFINTEPFKSRKNDFNIHAVQVPPIKEKNTLKVNNGTLGHDKYALASDEWAFREYATQAPYDYAVILINSDESYGGSLYNLYITATVRAQSEDYIIKHEMGHHIAGIADKFYSHETPNDSICYSSYSDDLIEMINKVLDLHTK